jgi:hypothetical protein
MGPPERVAQLAATILNAAWWVRHYGRAANRTQRAQAILALGLTVRAAFDQSEDFEPLLAAIVDGLRPPELRPF